MSTLPILDGKQKSNGKHGGGKNDDCHGAPGTFFRVACRVPAFLCCSSAFFGSGSTAFCGRTAFLCFPAFFNPAAFLGSGTFRSCTAFLGLPFRFRRETLLLSERENMLQKVVFLFVSSDSGGVKPVFARGVFGYLGGEGDRGTGVSVNPVVKPCPVLGDMKTESFLLLTAQQAV